MVFADTSGLVGAFHARDARHRRAADAWEAIVRARQGLLTTQLVFAETLTLLRRRAGWQASRDVGKAMLDSGAIEIAGLDDEQLEAAFREFARNGDPTLSLCDAASFVVMRERGVRRAFTFDAHFADAGFELVP